jgi:AcrR family transcriptional regulator
MPRPKKSSSTAKSVTRAEAARPVRVPKQARSKRTREAVLEAAVTCFEKRGFDETTTAAIAARAGIGVGTLYGYFRDKREVLLELLDRYVKTNADRVILQLDPESWREADPREHVRAIIDDVFQNMDLSPGIQRILWERYFKDPGFREPFDAIRDTTHRAIAQFIDALAQADVGSDQPILREVDRETASFVILNAVQWNATQAVMHGTPNGTDAVVEATADLVSRYLFRD